MAAKEMFELLGYKQSTFISMLEYENVEIGRTILFMKNDEKKHEFKGVNIASIDKGFALSVELLNAINQQLKELGWLDE